jgi:hypothetical protein
MLSRAVSGVAVVLLVYLWLPVLGATRDPDACERWSERDVVADEVTLTDLIEARTSTVVVTVPSYLAAWPRDGIALPGLIAISDRRVLEAGDTLLWHELAHQHQYHRDGSGRFLASYVADWHRGLAAGCGYTEAYESISYEREAHRMVDQLRDDLGGKHSPKFLLADALLTDPPGPAADAES